MGYSFGGPDGSHRQGLVDALHRVRWAEDLPETVDGFDMRLLLETAADQIVAEVDVTDDMVDRAVKDWIMAPGDLVHERMRAALKAALTE